MKDRDKTRQQLIEDLEALKLQLKSLQKNERDYKRLKRDLLEVLVLDHQKIKSYLHDSLCQILTGISFLSQLLEQKLTSTAAPELEDATHITELVDKAITQTRMLINGLISTELVRDDFVMALKSYASYLKERHDVICDVECDKDAGFLTEDLALPLFLIAREAVARAIEDRAAHTIKMQLTTNAEVISFRVIGNGEKDIPTHSTERELSLRTIAYCADMIGASLNVQESKEEFIIECTLGKPTGKMDGEK